MGSIRDIAIKDHADLPPHVMKALKHAWVDIKSCIHLIEPHAVRAQCEGLRQTLDLIENAIRRPESVADIKSMGEK